MPGYAVLLRGVNVGGRGLLPMAAFRDVLGSLGYDGVRTYLQSGNAVLAAADPAERVAADVQAALREAVGRDVDVVVRSADDLRRVVDGWPFDHDAAPTTKHVTFLRSAADAGPLQDLALNDFAPERLAVAGPDVYLSLPNGLGRSRLAPVLTRRLQRVVSTTRNWNTVTALADLAGGLG